MRENGKSLKTGAIAYLVVMVLCIVVILMTLEYAMLRNELVETKGLLQVYANDLGTLSVENRAFVSEVDNLQNTLDESGRSVNAVKEVLRQINFEEIQLNPGGVDLWIQICLQELEGN